MFWDAFIRISMVDMYLYGSEILRRLVIRNVIMCILFLFYFGERNLTLRKNLGQLRTSLVESSLQKLY